MGCGQTNHLFHNCVLLTGYNPDNIEVPEKAIKTFNKHLNSEDFVKRVTKVRKGLKMAEVISIDVPEQISPVNE